MALKMGASQNAAAPKLTNKKAPFLKNRGEASVSLSVSRNELMKDEGGVLKAAPRSSCSFAQPLLLCNVYVRQLSYLHSHALCSVKLMKTLFCCLWGFILFICEER